MDFHLAVLCTEVDRRPSSLQRNVLNQKHIHQLSYVLSLLRVLTVLLPFEVVVNHFVDFDDTYYFVYFRQNKECTYHSKFTCGLPFSFLMFLCLCFHLYFVWFPSDNIFLSKRKSFLKLPKTRSSEAIRNSVHHFIRSEKFYCQPTFSCRLSISMVTQLYEHGLFHGPQGVSEIGASPNVARGDLCLLNGRKYF